MFDAPRRQERTIFGWPEFLPGMGSDVREPLAGFENLESFAQGAMPGDLTGQDTPPITLTGEDLQRFEYRFWQAWNNSKTRMVEIHEQARKDREVYKTMEREPAYEGGPDITTPLSANKADGVLAHIRDSLEQRPLVTFSGEGIGRAGEEATEVAHLAQTYMEREINRSGSREIITSQMPREAVQVGTGIAKISVGTYPDEDFVQYDRAIRLENFYVDRVNVDDLQHVFCAYEYKERMYNLEDQAEMGLLDRAQVQKIADYGISSARALIQEEEEKQFSESSSFEDENAVHTLVQGYMRFRRPGERDSILYEVIAHPSTRTILAAHPNSARAAADAPPLRLFRVGKQAGYLFGRGIIERLKSEQKMADNAINTHIAINNLAASPPFAYRASSPFGQALQRRGRQGIIPGMGIPTANTPDKSDVMLFDQFRNNGQALRDMDIAFGFADRATYTEEAIGTQADPRKTLGQYQVEVQKGTMRLRIDVADFAYDAAEAMTFYWSMVVAHKIAPRGVVEIDQGGRLIATEDIASDEMIDTLVGAIQPMLESGELTPQEAIELDQSFARRLTRGGIPGVRRSDLTISMTGTKIIADKVSELQMLMQLTPYITSLIQAAAEDTYINYHMRSIMRSMGFSDIEKRMPADPGVVIEDEERRQALLMQMNEIQMRSSLI